MDARSDTSAVSNNGPMLASSLLPQNWSNQYSGTARTHSSLFNVTPVDQPTLAQRTTALRQLNGFPRRPQRRNRQTTPAGNRSSLASQPVIVRTYSAETDFPGRSSNMSRGPARSTNNEPPLPLPPIEEFSIDGILRAIEPDIQITLDTIAEICGRSKLSLANEYGSHRPPLGEIRASSRTVEHGLHPVEEASSSNEHLADDNVVIIGEDTSTVDGQDAYPPTYNFLDGMSQGTTVLDYRSSMPPSWGASASSQRQATNQHSGLASPHIQNEGHSQAVNNHQETKTPQSAFDWDLLDRRTEQDTYGHRRNVSTEPIISEVHLDAQAERTARPIANTPRELQHHHDSHINTTRQFESSPKSEKLSLLANLQEWLSWFKTSASKSSGKHGADVSVSPSAESRLRTVLERHNLELPDSHDPAINVARAL